MLFSHTEPIHVHSMPQKYILQSTSKLKLNSLLGHSRSVLGHLQQYKGADGFTLGGFSCSSALVSSCVDKIATSNLCLQKKEINNQTILLNAQKPNGYFVLNNKPIYRLSAPHSSGLTAQMQTLLIFPKHSMDCFLLNAPPDMSLYAIEYPTEIARAPT